MEGCLVCGEELNYAALKKATCHFCRREFETQVQCQDGHFVCDRCHQGDAVTFLKGFISQTPLTDPVAMAKQIFKHPSFKMHGPEHHFLIPATILRSLENVGVEVPQNYWKLIETRCSQLPGGMCGYWGACGAGVSTGITTSILAGCSPLKRENFDTIHLATSEALANIASAGGPRCCKRNIVLALEALLSALHRRFELSLKHEPFVCEHFSRNKECLHRDCPFFPRREPC